MTVSLSITAEKFCVGNGMRGACDGYIIKALYYTTEVFEKMALIF